MNAFSVRINPTKNVIVIGAVALAYYIRRDVGAWSQVISNFPEKERD